MDQFLSHYVVGNEEFGWYDSRDMFFRLSRVFVNQKDSLKRRVS